MSDARRAALLLQSNNGETLTRSSGDAVRAVMQATCSLLAPPCGEDQRRMDQQPLPMWESGAP